MKIRTDFVTNSSSSSFVLDILVETEDDERYLLYRHYKLSGDYLDGLDYYDDFDEDYMGEYGFESDPSEDGSAEGANNFHLKLLKEISNGRTYYKGSKVKSIIRRTVVEGFNEGGADETYELGDKLKAKFNAGDDFELDEKSIENFEKFLHDRWDGFLVEEESTTLDGDTSSWYSFNYDLFEVPSRAGIKKRNHILDYPKDPSDKSQITTEVVVEEIPCRNINEKYNPKLEKVIDEILSFSGNLASTFKNDPSLVQEPQIIKTLIKYSGSSKFGLLWKKADFSLFNPVRVALYCMLNDIRLIDEFDPAVIRKAKEIKDNYFKSENHLKYYHLLNDLPLENKVREISGYYCFDFDAYLEKEVEGMLLVKRKNIPSFYEILRNPDCFDFQTVYGYLTLCGNVGDEEDDYEEDDYEEDDYDEDEDDYDEDEEDEDDYDEDEEDEVDYDSLPVTKMKFRIKDYDSKSSLSLAYLNFKYGLNFIMDGVKKDNEGNLLILCRYGIKPIKDAKIVLLDPNENSADELIMQKYRNEFPNGDLDNIIADVFERYNPESTLWIDDLSGYDNSPIKVKNVLVEVKFRKGANKKYACYLEVGLGSQVKVSGSMRDEIGIVVAIYDNISGRHENVTEVLNGYVDIQDVIEASKPQKQNKFVNKYLWNTKNDSDYATQILSDNELSKFWDLDFDMARLLIEKSEISADECVYPYEDKVVNIFYLAIVKYLIKYGSISITIVKNYIDGLISKGWSFNKYKANILNVIDMLMAIRDFKDNLEELYSMINMIDKENE